MENLCIHYGPLIGHYKSKPYYDMPSPIVLSGPGVTEHLRQLGFGYRAKYLYQTAKMVSQERDLGWLDSLRNPESPVMSQKFAPAGEMPPGGRQGYRAAHKELLALQGVGPKVADCVCLMGLGWGEAVPVDTHGTGSLYHFSQLNLLITCSTVWHIAQRDYKFGRGKHRSLTNATYDAVGDHFRSLWGKEAGWAHSVLFTADLRAFATRLTTKVEVSEVKKEEEEEEETLQVADVKSEIDSDSSLKRKFTEDQTLIKAESISTTPRRPKRRREKPNP